MRSLPVALIEQVLRFFFPCWIEHGQLLYHTSAQRACRNAVCNCIAPLAESFIVFPRFLMDIDIRKIGEIEVRSSGRAPNQHIYKPGALQLRPREPRALQLRPMERRALQLRLAEVRALQLRPAEVRALQLRPNETRALQLPREPAALQRPNEVRALQLCPKERRALQLPREPRALQLRPAKVGLAQI